MLIESKVEWRQPRLSSWPRKRREGFGRRVSVRLIACQSVFRFPNWSRTLGALGFCKIDLQLGLTEGRAVVHDFWVEASTQRFRGCSSVVEHLLAKERVESSNLFIRLFNLALVPLDPICKFGCRLEGGLHNLEGKPLLQSFRRRRPLHRARWFDCPVPRIPLGRWKRELPPVVFLPSLVPFRPSPDRNSSLVVAPSAAEALAQSEDLLLGCWTDEAVVQSRGTPPLGSRSHPSHPDAPRDNEGQAWVPCHDGEP